MTTHSMDEAETLCKRMGIMVNGEFVCLGKASQIKENYGYGYEIDLRIKPLSVKQINCIIEELNKDEDILLKNKIMNNYMINDVLNIDSVNSISVKYDRKSRINRENIRNILIKLNKAKYIDELKENRLGKKILKDIEINGYIGIITLLNWTFFIENAFKFISVGKNYFDEIILDDFIENNFLFKMKKGPKTKSIGFFFGLFEKYKEKCFVTEYSIQQTSLEQIFNMFAKEQIGVKNVKLNKNKNGGENKENNKDKNECKCINGWTGINCDEKVLIDFSVANQLLKLNIIPIVIIIFYVIFIIYNRNYGIIKDTGFFKILLFSICYVRLSKTSFVLCSLFLNSSSSFFCFIRFYLIFVLLFLCYLYLLSSVTDFTKKCSGYL